MLSIFVTQELERTSNKDLQIVYYFCRNDDDKRNSAVAVLRSLLWQILGKCPALANLVLQYFESPERTQSSLSSQEALWTMFAKILQDSNFHPTTCVLDGLDECDEASRAWLIRKFIALTMPKGSASTTPPFSLAIVSRDMPGLERSARVKLDPDHDAEVRSDIEIFVSDRVDDLSLRIPLNDDFRRYVEAELLEGANGTFLWVGFAMTELLEKKTCSEIEETLRSLPNSLPAIYGRMLQQIEPRRRNACAAILSWVTLAVRPLSVQELATALSVQATSILTMEHVMRDRIALCGAILATENDRVSLVHQSARDYLLRTDEDSDNILEEFRILPERTHVRLAWTCLDYMQQGEVLTHKFRGAVLKVTSYSHSPLLQYAVFHWPYHAISSNTLGQQLLDHPSGFFEDGSSLQLQWRGVYSSVDLELPKKPSSTSLHLACYLGLMPWVKHFLQNDRHDTVGRCRIDDLDYYGRTPLSYAARQGHEEIARLLLHWRADVNAKGDFGQRALHMAAQEGHKSVVQLLLDNGADVDAEDVSERTGFQWAASRGFEAVMQLLLDYGADCNAGDKNGLSALGQAASKGKEATVRLLLKYGANANAKGSGGGTALHEAGMRGNEAIVRLLLDHGANPDAKDKYGATAANYATWGGHEAVMRLLNRA